MHSKVLLVDDEPAVREYLAFLLIHHGFCPVEFPDGPSALAHLSTARDEIAMIISDISMAEMSGIKLLCEVRAFAPEMPFVLLSGSCDQPLAIDAYRAGATDYLMKPVSEKDFINIVKKSLHRNEYWNEDLVRNEVCHFLAKTPESSAGRIDRLFQTLGNRRFETMQHSQRVAAFSRLIGLHHGIEGKALEELEVGALLHDIGKLAIPQNIIDKPGLLNPEERRVMQLHAAIGASLLREIPGCANESEIILSHHERFDGQGYPNGLVGSQIPIGARIFAVADALDAICSDRPYRKAASLDYARREIENMRGTQFDPAVVQSFRLVSDSEIQEVRAAFTESSTENLAHHFNPVSFDQQSFHQHLIPTA